MAFHAGVAGALSDGGVRPDKVSGASSGSVVAGAVAAGLGADLPRLFFRFAGRSIVSLRRLLWNRSLFDMSHLVRHALRDTLGDGDLRQKPVEALVPVTRVPSLTTTVLSSHQERDMVEVILGSCYIPVLYGRPIRLGKDWVLDGGWGDNLPLDALARRGCDDIIAVVVSADGSARRTVSHRGWKPTVDGARLSVIRPSRPLALKSWDLSADRARQAIDDGYAAGRAFLGH